jgi:hypothetical protein
MDGRVLFKSLGNGYDSCLHFAYNPLDLYATGYLQAGDILVDYIESQRHHLDTLLYPIVFNYRQYLELRLKEIIHNGRTLLEEEGRYPNNHKLHELWVTAKPIMMKIWEEHEEPSEFDMVETVFNEFAELDSSSISFRYPEDKQGNVNLVEIRHLNAPHIKMVIHKVSGFLDGVSMGIGAYIDQRNEISAVQERLI